MPVAKNHGAEHRRTQMGQVGVSDRDVDTDGASKSNRSGDLGKLTVEAALSAQRTRRILLSSAAAV
jgi:hypothetical protein